MQLDEKIDLSIQIESFKCVHLCCCRDEGVMLCGVRRYKRVSQEEATTCADCVEVDEKYPIDFCLQTGECVAKDPERGCFD